ncbi:GDSL esterase/lipase At5g03610 isoform X1 [Punica granatum]|uniref:GDSL esterase/lipase At5g03610 isoform X1 n=1 Tax=Punica granatum TaxID=22663 RepID=A0A6P8DMA3_PUNGR|nr:GDSL esterase/lipase At5g03610 isoform X1 [Punica granatum]
MEKSSWNPLLLPSISHLLSLWLILSSAREEVIVAGKSLHHHRHQGHTHSHSVAAVRPLTFSKLFVFGDSYADTGNTGKQGSAWKVPYGMTFPGKPSGRYSDGLVLTDFLAKYLGLKSPVAYRWRNVVPPQSLKYGVNFATGGTGVFDTLTAGPNMSRQTDFFQKLLSTYRSEELQSSVALVVLSGNDYAAYLVRNGSIEVLPTFISLVVNQLTANVKRIHELGVRRIVVSALAPLGCLPAITINSSYRQCNGTFNAFVTFHNQLLQRAMAKLNRQGVNDKPPATSSFILFDLYRSFSSVLNPKGNSTFQNPLKPCCVGTGTGYSCGSLDSKTGEKKYSVCSNPERAFFWDMVHPTQEGWRAVFSQLMNTLQQLFKDI